MENTATYVKTRNSKKTRLCTQINEYLEHCAVMRQMSPLTIASKITAYKNLLTETDCGALEKLTNKQFDKFIKAELERGVSASSINQKTANIIAMVRYWREMGTVIPLKTPLIKKLKERPTRRVFYTREEIDEVLEKCDSEAQWLLIRIAFDTGMRIAELTNLSLNQMSGQRINFIGKGAKPREVYICDDTFERLSAYIEQNEITDRVWLNEYGNPLAVSTIRKIMTEAFVRCGHTNFYPHALRHSFGSDIQRQGADVMVIKEMMGHSNVATTQRYLHGFEGQLEALFRKYKGQQR